MNTATATPPQLSADAPARPDQSTGAVELTVVMPCLNEAATLGTCIRKAQDFLERHGVRGEVVIGDNGSTDGSQEIARKMGARVIDVPVKGYGMALHYAAMAARGKYVIMGDSDDSYDFSALMPFLEKLREGADLVMGNRFLGGIRPKAMPFMNRYLGNPVLSFIGRVLFRCPARDFHCGLRGYSIDAYHRMGLRTSGMEYASEMVIKATLLGMRVVEVPTTLDPDGRGRPPHLRPWRDGWRHLRFMLLFSPRWLFFYPGTLLMLVGLIVGIWLLPGPRKIGSVTLDVHTLLYAALAVLIGFEMLALGLFSNLFSSREGLLPRSQRMKAMLKFLRLEVGLALGLALTLAGVIGSIFAVGEWGATSFGPLDYHHTMRLVVPSFLALAMGAQLILASFFLGVLVNLPTRRDDPLPGAES